MSDGRQTDTIENSSVTSSAIVHSSPDIPVKQITMALILFLILGAIVSYIDHVLVLHTMLVESVHAIVVTAIFFFFLSVQKKYPEINQFGWPLVVVGVFFLMLGSWIDILDDEPMLKVFEINGIPFGRSWQQAFIKKILGYTAGVGLMAYGLFQWIPWMINTRLNVQALNKKLAETNQKLNRLVMNMDDHIESERLNLSRELHDDIAQQLTFLGVQAQLKQKELTEISPESADAMKTLRESISDVLKSVRHLSRNLRPESLYGLGLVAAIDQYLDKMRAQHQNIAFSLSEHHAENELQIETKLDERQLLHVFRVIQEGINNVVKHSNAGALSIAVENTAEHIRIRVEDTGHGYPWSNIPDNETLLQQGHMGLVGMGERVMEIGGELKLYNKVIPENNRKKVTGACMEVIIANE